MARTPKSGRPTPVIKKPIVAGIVFTPAFCPMKTGNIKFPAPKNNANSMSPIAINALFVFSPIKIFLSAILQNTRELQPLPQVDTHFVCYVRNIISHFPLIINHFFNISPSVFRRPPFRKRHAFP